jgi:hypothetical protein
MEKIREMNLKKIMELNPEKRFNEIEPLIETKSEYLKILDKFEQLLSEIERFNTETEFFKKYGYDWVPVAYYIENGEEEYLDIEFATIFDFIREWVVDKYASEDIALLKFKYELYEQTENPNMSNKIVRIKPLDENQNYEIWLWFEKE